MALRHAGLRNWIAFVVAALLLVAAPTAAPAQNATPVASPAASPVPGAVPYTALFGIAAGNACVLSLNGSIDAGPVDLYVDGSLVAAGAVFGTLGEFVPVPPGNASSCSCRAAPRRRARSSAPGSTCAMGRPTASRRSVPPGA